MRPLPQLAPIRACLAAQLILVENFSARREAFLASRRMERDTESAEEAAEVQEDGVAGEEDD